MGSARIGDFDSFITIFKRILRDNQEWYSDINESSKAYHYKNFKCILVAKTYLSLDMSSKYIHTFSKFRCSAHH